MDWEKILVRPYWKGKLHPATLWRCPTTGWHGDSWLLGHPSDPMRPSLDNLIHWHSCLWPMLMPGLVRTPNRHAPGVTWPPYRMPAQSLTSQLQDYRSAPRSQSMLLDIHSPDHECLNINFCLYKWLQALIAKAISVKVVWMTATRWQWSENPFIQLNFKINASVSFRLEAGAFFFIPNYCRLLLRLKKVPKSILLCGDWDSGHLYEIRQLKQQLLRSVRLSLSKLTKLNFAWFTSFRGVCVN